MRTPINGRIRKYMSEKVGNFGRERYCDFRPSIGSSRENPHVNFFAGHVYNSFLDRPTGVDRGTGKKEKTEDT